MLRSFYLREDLHQYGLCGRLYSCLSISVPNNFQSPSERYRMATYSWDFFGLQGCYYGHGFKAVLWCVYPVLAIALLTRWQGLGNYLESIDPEGRSWRWHLKKVLILCRVHFLRSIDKLAGTTNKAPDSLYGRMRALLSCQSREEYFQLCDLLISMITLL